MRAKQRALLQQARAEAQRLVQHPTRFVGTESARETARLIENLALDGYTASMAVGTDAPLCGIMTNAPALAVERARKRRWWHQWRR